MNCSGPHKAGDVYRPWQHSPECKNSLGHRVRKTRIIPAAEVPAEDRLVDRLVERAREAGAL